MLGIRKFGSKLSKKLRRLLAIGAVTGVAIVAGAAGAVAVTTGHATTQFHNFTARTETNAWTGAGTAWTDIPNAYTLVSVPGGQYRTFHATFTAESQCEGSGWCSVRIVVVRPNGSWVELNPASGTDFAFDSPGGSPWDGNAMQRTSNWEYAATTGVYRIKAQAIRVAGATSFRLDDYNLAVIATR